VARVKVKSPRASETVSEVLNVDKIVAGGLGFARRHNGESVFVRGAVPGDEVELQRLERHTGYSQAQQFRILQPSPDRRTAPCEYQHSCGGCDLMPLKSAAQQAAKHGMVLDILRRIAKLDASEHGAVPLTWRHPTDAQTLGYRSRIRLHVSPRGKLGFRAEQSHTVVDVSRCLVANPSVNVVLAHLSHCATLNPQLFTPFSQVEIRALGERPDLLWFLRASTQPAKRTPLASSRSSHRTPATNPALEGSNQTLETLRRSLENLVPSSTEWLMSVAPNTGSWKASAQTVPLPAKDEREARLLFAPGMFTQVNWQVNRAIVSDLLQQTHELGLRRFLDLYCGAGNFSLPLLASGLQGIGIESNPLSIDAAQTACAHQGYGGRFMAGDVPHTLAAFATRQESFDLVLLDPPRAGFKDAAPYLARIAKNAVFVCSCDPATFARDIRLLLELGFVLRALTAYDMFPQTHHVELTAWLLRADT
jgi:23S rRNA (uracil1939-C5)-methyltransferase